MSRRRSKRDRPRRRARTATGPRAPKPTEAETRLLALARELGTLPAAAGTPAALRLLAAAHAPDAPLPRAIAQAWNRSRGDKTAALALAWAREQVRLALEEILGRAPRGTLGGNVETRAWLLLAAAEAIAQEPPEAAADRLRALLDLTGHGPAPA
jgi:hypothetical protein